MFRNTGGGFALVAILIAGCLLVFRTTDVQLGIDLEGGTELTYTIDKNQVPAARRDTAIEEVKQILTNRFDQYGIKELSITPQGYNNLVIQIPSTDNREIEQIKRGIEEAGRLTIHLVADQAAQAKFEEIEATAAQFQREWLENEDKKAQGLPAKEMHEFPDQMVVVDGETATKLVVESAPGMYVDGKYIENAQATVDEMGTPAVSFTFNSVGAALFAELTGANVNKSLAMVLDGTAKSTANIRDRISRDGQLTGNFSQDEVNEIVTLLRSGSLPVAPEYEGENRIGALLGQDSIQRGTQAMAIGFALVLAFLLVYYRFVLGGIAATTLLFNMTLVFAFIMVFRNSLTLPGMAGLLLTVGMAVDANILIYERIREERLKGRGLTQSISSGFSRAFSTIFDANLTTLITAWILFVNGTGPIKGFAVVLSIGIICTFFSSLFFSRLIISFLVKNGYLTDVKMMSIVENPKIDFLSLRKTARAASIVLIGVGIVCLVARNTESLGIDFTGGTRLIANLNQPTTEGSMRDLVQGLGDDFDDVQIQAINAEGGSARQFSIRTRAIVREGEEGVDETKSAANAFKAKIEEALAAKGWLAPNTFANEATVAAGDGTGQVYSVDVNIRGSEGKSLTPDSVKQLLTEGAYPVATVQPKSGGQGNVWSTFTVASTPQPTTGTLHDDLYALLDKAQKNQVLEIADPFPEVSTIGSRVAQDMQSKVFVAMLLAFAAIIFYISLRFHFTFGLAAIVALVHDIFFTLGALAVGDLLFGSFLNLKINLPVVAALLTVVGYSLNDTIVIFDRIRENIGGKKRNVDYEKMVNVSINQTLSRTLLTSVTTFVVVAILLIWGGEALQGFAFALCIGVLVGTYSSIYVASPSLIYFQERAEKRREAVLAEAAAAGEL